MIKQTKKQMVMLADIASIGNGLDAAEAAFGQCRQGHGPCLDLVLGCDRILQIEDYHIDRLGAGLRNSPDVRG